MKNYLFLTIAMLVAMVVASCSKEQDNKVEVQNARVVVKLAGVVKTRAIEAPGKTAAGTIDLTNGYIFVLSIMNDIVHGEEFDLDATIGETSAGQVLEEDVPSDSRVYVIANYPSSVTTTQLAALENLSDIITLTAAMSTQTDYKTAALANIDAEPEAITVKTGVTPDNDNQATVEADVTVTINPLISRLELAKVTGGPKVTAFTVTGVYVDDWYDKFTFGGTYTGSKYSQGMKTTFTGNALREEGEWLAESAVPGADPFVAIPTNNINTPEQDIWAFNVAAGTLPRLIIRLEDVKYMADHDDDAGTPDIEIDETETLYLTVTSYDGVTTFERGVIYNIGGDVDGGGIVFDPDDTGFTPNPDYVTLEVTVAVDQWELATPDANL